MVGGSADLTGSNNTDTKSTPPLDPASFEGRHIHYGIREHAMVAAMNGMALHRGVIPYGGTFLIFTDYARPAIRLAALDAAAGDRRGDARFDRSRRGRADAPAGRAAGVVAGHTQLPRLPAGRCRRDAGMLGGGAAARHRPVDHGAHPAKPGRACAPRRLPENLSARGAYVLAEADGDRAATLLATGSEVGIAMAAKAELDAEGLPTAVVSMPCMELFEQQGPGYRASVLGTAPRVAVEAASPFGWTRYVASEDDVVGMSSFGASAPFETLYSHFGITAAAVAERVRRLV